LILEHLNGKELFDQIKERGYYNERDAATILRCILNALVVLHSNQIVHRDLKPENLIFRDDNLNSLVIIDFGLSTTCKDGSQFTRCGSPGYVAPEILNNLGYGCKVDIFSLGVIMYILLTSKFVFNAKDYNEILRRNKQCKVHFPKKLWDNLSEDAQNLCSLML
jgi:calcium/calmodulin-dependent protein kinase I